ncbi:Erythronate-4-phosphate dehydrogenase [hydrothermal vent metagenome]|uniref:Erythronate-4-phosphate dehydrogenase n=1 Tax=hydrothermal vent metagenome TaxID=652676 RepID=A0A3B0VQQ3_9ZZZZ
MNSPKTLIIDDAIPYAQEIFSHLGRVITVPGKEIQAHTVRHADALIVRSRTQVNQSLLQNSRIQFVGSTVVGLDHIDQRYLQQHNIPFYSAQGCNANSVAEFIIATLLDLAEHFQFNLFKKTLGIIGVGHVGKLVHQKATALGLTCLLNDPPRARFEKDKGGEKNNFVSLEACLTADIITFHTPLTTKGEDATLDLLSAERLKAIQPHQILINAARGGIINESAWQHTPTLANVIDCWENEPNISPPLYQTAYLATPHIAGHSLDAKVAGSSMVYHALCKAWNKPPQTDWQQNLPPLPPVIQLEKKESHQATLHALFKQTHNIQHDDQAIRADNIQQVHQKYEHYRRNYPIYREWHCHTIKTQNDPAHSKLLKALNFRSYLENNAYL